MLDVAAIKIASGVLATAAVGTGAYVAMPDAKAGCTVTHEMRKAGPTKVTSCNGAMTTEPLTLRHRPAPGSGGLVLRDAQGRSTGSGIGEKQQFDFMYCGPKGSGLIFVNQVDRFSSGGGWGSLYAGYVKKAYTSSPNSYPCN